MESDDFGSTPLPDACLTQPSEVSFANLHDSINSVSTSFHQPSFTSSSIPDNQNSDKIRPETITFQENVLPIRIYSGASGQSDLNLTKQQHVERDKLAELCQASDVEDGQDVTSSIAELRPNQSVDDLSREPAAKLGTTGDHDANRNTTEQKGGSVDPSDASDLLQEIQENNKNRLQGLFSPPIDVPPFQVDEAAMLEMEKLSQEKNTLFSENLGLIAKDSKEFRSLTKLKPARKGVRTRKSAWSPITAEYSESDAESGHKHVKCSYKCACCSRMFKELCKLHDHLICQGNGGSYHYDHVLKTAFPKFDSACAFTQTSIEDIVIQDVSPSKKQLTKPVIKPLRNVVKPKGKIVTQKGKTKKEVCDKTIMSPTAILGKRGRPRKGKKGNKEVKKPNKDKPIAKLKVKTEDGGNTWQGVDMMAQSEKDGVENVDEELDIQIDVVPPMQDEDRVEKTSKLVNKYLKEIENDIASFIDNDKDPGVKEKSEEKTVKAASRKRKMSIPRKLAVGSTEEVGQIVNSRVRPEKKIACEFCPCKFQYTRGLIRHEQEKHEEKMKFECEICHIKFMREYNKERHLLCAHTTGRAKLVQEKKAAAKEARMSIRKPKEKQSEESKACEECGKIVPESKAAIHSRLHSGERPFICHVCGKGLISDKKLKRHLLIHSSVMRHTCEVCGQGFSMKYKLRTHMYIHTGHKPYLCSVCGAEFNNSTSLLHHHRTVHLGDKRFECKICGGKYGKKSQLDEHMFSHSAERTQTCRYCGKTFKHAKSLRRHESTHVTNEKYQCDQCDSKFSRKDNLERHKMCHFDVTLQCRFCKKKFRKKKPLEDHEEFHINQKRLQCQLCKEKFQDETYFYNHMEKQHEITQEMLPLVTMGPLNPDDNKDINIPVGPDNNIIISSLKMAIGGGTGSDVGNQSIVVTGHQDTLNLSMNAAGIIPTSNQDLLGNPTQPNIQSILVTPNTGHATFNHSQNTVGININTSRILNQPINPSLVAGAHIIPGIHDGQRTIVNVINPDDNTTIRLPLDQPATETMMLHEQQRLMQEALSSSLNMQNSGYRLQNLY